MKNLEQMIQFPDYVKEIKGIQNHKPISDISSHIMAIRDNVLDYYMIYPISNKILNKICRKYEYYIELYNQKYLDGYLPKIEIVGDPLGHIDKFHSRASYNTRFIAYNFYSLPYWRRLFEFIKKGCLAICQWWIDYYIIIDGEMMNENQFFDYLNNVNELVKIKKKINNINEIN